MSSGTSQLGASDPPISAASCEDLTVSYAPGAPPALNAVSLTLKPGRVVGLVGPNGAGKSTFIHALAGVRTPTRGTVTVTGGSIGWCAQQLMIDWFVSVRTNVWPGARLAGLVGRAAWARADECLAAVGLDSVGVDKTPESLSGGQQQRLMIARVLAMKASVMLLDEPTVGLDLTNIGRLKDAVLTARDQGALVVLSSHDFTAIESLVDEIVLLHHGALRFHGPVEDFVSRYARTEEVSIQVGAPVPAHVLNHLGHKVTVSEDRLTFTLRQPVGTPIGGSLLRLESAGANIVDVLRRGVQLSDAFIAAVEEDQV